MNPKQPDFDRYVDPLGDLLCRFEEWRVVHRINPTLSLALLSVAAPLAASFEPQLNAASLTATIEAAKNWLELNRNRFASLYETGDDEDLEDSLSDAASDDPPPPPAAKPIAAKKKRGEDWRRK